MPNAAQQRVLDDLRAGYNVKVVGPAGFGKTALAMEWLCQVAEARNVRILAAAPWNTQKDLLRRKLRTCRRAAELQVVMPQTWAALMGLPANRAADVRQMIESLSEERLHMLKEATHMLLDEADLPSPKGATASERLVRRARGSDVMWGGVQLLMTGDPLQGLPRCCAQELEFASGAQHAGAVHELTFESQIMEDPRLRIHCLVDCERIKDELFVRGVHGEIRYGIVGGFAERLRQVTMARVFTAEEDLYATTIYARSVDVMERSVRVMPLRAARRGWTVANGGVYVYKDAQAIATYKPMQLNALRTFGFEKQTFVLNEKMLLVVKGREANDEKSPAPSLHMGPALQYDDKSYATGNEVCEIVAFAEGKIKIKVEGRREGANMLWVPVVAHTMTVKNVSVTVRSYPLKPFFERVWQLTQGLEFDLVHVDATHFFGDACLYVALTRVTNLAGLKVSGLWNRSAMVGKTSANWRAVLFVARHGEAVPEEALVLANRRREMWEMAHSRKWVIGGR